MTEARNTNFTGDPKLDAVLSGENARDINDALSDRLLAYTYGPIEYTAVGAITATIPILCEDRPRAVLLVNCYAVGAPSDSVAAVGSLNFRWDSSYSSAYVPEPSGLTANTNYGITFLIVR